MEFRDEYAKFNEFYYKKLNNLFENAKSGTRFPATELVEELLKNQIDIDRPIVYKKLLDEEASLTIGSKKYILLPMGLINMKINLLFISDDYLQSIKVVPYVTEKHFRRIFLEKPVFDIFYYPEFLDRPLDESFAKCCDAYIKYYRETLGENWSKEDFYKMLKELKYLSVKYAQDEDTGEIFIIGFFGASIRSGAGGKCLTNAELFVMPEFRHLGIAQNMVGLSLFQAKQNGVENFDSVTYRAQPIDALAFWEKVGASVSGLVHIEGSISVMLEVIDKNNKSSKTL